MSLIFSLFNWMLVVVAFFRQTREIKEDIGKKAGPLRATFCTVSAHRANEFDIVVYNISTYSLTTPSPQSLPYSSKLCMNIKLFIIMFHIFLAKF